MGIWDSIQNFFSNIVSSAPAVTDYSLDDFWNMAPKASTVSNVASSVVKPVASAAKSVDWSGIIKNALPVAGLIYGANRQSNMMEGLADANREAYNTYLGNLQTPEPVKAAQYGAASQQIATGSSKARRRLSNELAGRGIRGEGVAAPLAEHERERTMKELMAYLDIYGRYNPPQAPPAANYAPGTTDLLGKSIGDLSTMMLLKQLAP